MRKRDFDQYRVERLLFLIQREQEKLNFFYERKYCRLECGRFFPPIRCSVIENPVSGESVERAGEDEASQSVRYSRVFGTFNHDDFRAVDESELCSGCGYAYVDHYKVNFTIIVKRCLKYSLIFFKTIFKLLESFGIK